MTVEKRIDWIAQMCAVTGVALWTAATISFRLYPLTALFAVTIIPATIYNLVCEVRK